MDILANRVRKLLTDNIGTYVGSFVSVGDLKIRNVTCDMVPGRPFSNSNDLGYDGLTHRRRRFLLGYRVQSLNAAGPYHNCSFSQC